MARPTSVSMPNVSAVAAVTFAVSLRRAACAGSRRAGGCVHRAVELSALLRSNQHWQPAAVSGSGASRTVAVAHPAANGFVSLRATAVDGAGNTAELTVLRAYTIGS